MERLDSGFKYKSNENGFITIFDVPIFELGVHKDVNFNENWASEALDLFEYLKSQDYLPVIKIGHNLLLRRLRCGNVISRL